MGRLSTIKDANAYGAVGALLAGRGAVTLQTIVDKAGVSIGSLYHRYGSREGLLAQTWLDAVKSFQGGFLAALESGGEDAGMQAALATPRFCRAERHRAIVLSCCRQSEFLSDDTPKNLREEIRSVNDAAGAAMQGGPAIGLTLAGWGAGSFSFRRCTDVFAGPPRAPGDRRLCRRRVPGCGSRKVIYGGPLPVRGIGGQKSATHGVTAC